MTPAAEEAVETVPAPEPRPPDPHWLADWKPYQDAALYLQTLRRVAFHPHRFGGAWVKGEVVAFNPAAFYLVSTALTEAVASLWRYLVNLPSQSPWKGALERVGQYAKILVFAGLVHHFIRVRVAKPRHFRSTVAATLYGSGAVNVLSIPIIFASVKDNGAAVYWVLSMTVLACAVGLTSLSLTGVHGLNRRLGIGTVVSAGFVSAMLWLGARLIGHRLGWL